MSRKCQLSPHQLHRLDLACRPLCVAFDDPPYLVGSVNERADYRDVDVRLMLDDKEFDRLFGKVAESDGAAHADAKWLLICASLSHWLSDVSGLPVDFQIQRRTEANLAHPHSRNPLCGRVWSL